MDGWELGFYDKRTWLSQCCHFGFSLMDGYSLFDCLFIKELISINTGLGHPNSKTIQYLYCYPVMQIM